MPRPTTAALNEFLDSIARSDTGLPVDPPIFRALALAAAHTAPYATRSAAAYSRRLAREVVMVAVLRPEAEARAAWLRLSNATTAAVDPSGDWLDALRAQFELIIAPRAADRAEYQASLVGRRPAATAAHLSPFELAYHREVRAMFTADRAPVATTDA